MASLIEKELPRKEVIKLLLLKTLIAYICFIALGGMLYSLLPMASEPILLITGAIAILFFQACFCFRKAYAVGICVPGGAIILMIIFRGKMIRNGFILCANEVLQFLSKNTGYIFIKYQTVLADDRAVMCVTMFLVLLAIMLSAICAYRERKPNAVLTIMIIIAEGFLLSVLGGGISSVWLVLVLASELMLLLRHTLTQYYEIGQKSAKIIICMLLLLSIAVSVPLYGLSVSTYKSGIAGHLNETISEKIEYMRYGSSKGDNLPEGDFNGLGSLSLKDTPVLEVTMSEPESLYLRGYVGSEYTGSGWVETDTSKLYESSDLFYWLHKDGFYGQTQLASVAQLLKADVEQDGEVNITVNNLSGNRKYIYAPYELIDAKSDILRADRIGDETLCSIKFRGYRQYSYTSLVNKVKQVSSLAAELYEAEESREASIQEYLSYESYYNQYIYKTYTYVPENIETLLRNHLGSCDTTGHTHMDYKQAEKSILKYLTHNTEYSEEISSSEYGYDFLQDFLEVTKKGYSVHYATTAALMFRYYGIPSRYVEGYIITPKDVEGRPAGSTITIDGTHAHAWVEIYRDGIGWVPFEATPAYFNIMEQDQEIEGIDSGTSGGNLSSNDELQDNIGEDNYEQETTTIIERLQERLIAVTAVIYYCILGIVILVAICILYKLINRKRIKEKRRDAFNHSNYNMAIEEMFIYVMELFKAVGMEQKNCYLDGYTMDAERLLGNELRDEFAMASAIYMEAHFSSHEMTEEQRDFIREFQMKALETTTSSLGFRKRLSLKYKKYLI